MHPEGNPVHDATMRLSEMRPEGIDFTMHCELPVKGERGALLSHLGHLD
jgi:hypothetical protein